MDKDPNALCGSTIDQKYLINRVLGAGAMGIVYEALHLELDEPVALKILHPMLVDDAVAAERFRREARAVAKLRSEHICRVMDVGGFPSGAPYIVMEYLEGRDLAQCMDKGRRFTPEQSMHYVLQACEALMEAHAIGIVHRDLKPQNLFLTRRRDGTEIVKVLDFGIAKATSLNGVELTTTGEVMGTPHFMSPEQILGSERMDARTDIWSVGAVLFNLLTGTTPFEATTFLELRGKISSTPHRRARACNPAVPDFAERIVDRCLEKDPAGRYASIADLIADVQRALAAREAHADSKPTPAATKRVAVAAVAGVLVLGALVWVAGRSSATRSPSPDEVSSTAIPLPASSFSSSPPPVDAMPVQMPAFIAPTAASTPQATESTSKATRAPGTSVTKPLKAPKIVPGDDTPDLRH